MGKEVDESLGRDFANLKENFSRLPEAVEGLEGGDVGLQSQIIMFQFMTP